MPEGVLVYHDMALQNIMPGSAARPLAARLGLCALVFGELRLPAMHYFIPPSALESVGAAEILWLFACLVLYLIRPASPNVQTAYFALRPRFTS